MAYETKLPRPVAASTVTEDLSEGSEVLPHAHPGPPRFASPAPAPATNALPPEVGLGPMDAAP